MGRPPAYTAQFQSHAGSIEACPGPREMRTEPWFQSHAGSIEARRIVNVRKRGHRFNPTLVRLRPLYICIGERKLDGFQSHAGSIEARSCFAGRLSRGEVSIPRWFD